MILHFHFRDLEPHIAEVATFPEFRAWLEGLGVGNGDPSPEVVSGWASTYQEMAKTGKSNICFARPAEAYNRVVTIDYVER